MVPVTVTLQEPTPPRADDRVSLPPAGGLRRRGRRWLRALPMLAFITVVVVVPLGYLVVNTFNLSAPGQPARYGLGNWIDGVGDPAFLDAMRTTLQLSLTRIPIALAIATILAWLIARTDMPGGRVLEVLFWVAFFIPGISVTLGWILLADPLTGVLNEAVRSLPGVSLERGPLNIFSFWGINLAHLTTTVPVMTILLIPVFRRMDATLEEAASTAGAGRYRTALLITLPLMAPAILSTGLLGLAYSLNAFEIELILGPQAGLQVFSTQIYNWLQATPPRYGISAALGVMFIPLLILLVLLQRYFLRRRSYTTVGAKGFSDTVVRLGRVGRWVAFGLTVGYLTFTVLLPVAAVILGSFMRRFGFFQIDPPYTTDNWSALFDDRRFLSSFTDSLQLGLAAAAVGVLVYFLLGYFVIRSPLPGRGYVDSMAWVPAGVPGLLLGFGLLWLFLATPLRSVMYGALAGLTLAVVINHMAVGTQQMKSALLQISPDHEAAARIAGASPARTHLFITAPLLSQTILAVGLLTFDSAMRNVSTVALLSSSDFQPLSILLLGYSTQGTLERGAALGTVMCAITITVGLIGIRLARGRLRQP